MSEGLGSRGSNRREFLAQGALLGGGLLAAAMEPTVTHAANALDRALARQDAPYELANPENLIYSSCLQCNTGCGIKCKLQAGVLSKIDGNPYSPWTLLPHLPQATPVGAAALVDAGICPKGQAGIQTVYDPYRIRKVLKRAGARGSNQWVTIAFEQAIKEIVEGGRLFAHLPGEENRQVPGLREIMALTDSAAAKAMANDVKTLWDKTITVKDFRNKHTAHLDKLIDPDHPDLGPKNNQFVIAWGRLKGGRNDFIKRFASGFGTINTHGHTTVCQGSLYFTCKGMSEQYDAGSFSGGKKFYWQADTENSRFILFVGANLFEANYGPPNRSVRLTDNLVQGRTRIAVVDPRFSKLASKAWKYLPIKPGEDTALAMAMLRWMIESGRYDARFLENANKAAATADNEPSWCNATWLVELDKDGHPGAFARAADHGLATAETRKTKDGKEYQEKLLLVMRRGTPVAFDPNDTKTPVEGDLFVDAALPDGTRAKSALQLLREKAFERSMRQWCSQAGLKVADVASVALELTSHGKAAAVDIHRGVSQHTNGFHAVLAWMSVNVLLGNFDHKGGMIAASTFGYDASKGGPFPLGTTPGSVPTFGVSIIRHEVPYEKTTLFAGYPARRPWYPLASDVYEEIVPSIGDGYPYPVKALFLYMGTPVYALPAGHTNAEILCDTDRLPLFFVSDIVVGTTSMYADYIFPDLSYLERWEMQGSHPNVAQKVQPIRQPAVAPIPEPAACSVRRCLSAWSQCSWRWRSNWASRASARTPWGRADLCRIQTISICAPWLMWPLERSPTWLRPCLTQMKRRSPSSCERDATYPAPSSMRGGGRALWVTSSGQKQCTCSAAAVDSRSMLPPTKAILSATHMAPSSTSTRRRRRRPCTRAQASITPALRFTCLSSTT